MRLWEDNASKGGLCSKNERILNISALVNSVGYHGGKQGQQAAVVQETKKMWGQQPPHYF